MPLVERQLDLLWLFSTARAPRLAAKELRFTREVGLDDFGIVPCECERIENLRCTELRIAGFSGGAPTFVMCCLDGV